MNTDITRLPGRVENSANPQLRQLSDIVLRYANREWAESATDHELLAWAWSREVLADEDAGKFTPRLM